MSPELFSYSSARVLCWDDVERLGHDGAFGRQLIAESLLLSLGTAPGLLTELSFCEQGNSELEASTDHLNSNTPCFFGNWGSSGQTWGEFYPQTWGSAAIQVILVAGDLRCVRSRFRLHPS